MIAGIAGSAGTASLPPGANSIAAAYSGDANNAATTSYLGQQVMTPQFNAITPGTDGLIMSGSWGTSNATFYLLASTNLNLPISQWTPVLTNQFDNNGNYNLTNPVSAARSLLHPRDCRDSPAASGIAVFGHARWRITSCDDCPAARFCQNWRNHTA